MVMVIKLDKQGRFVLPKDIRDKYHFEPNVELQLIEKEDSIEIKIAKKKVSLSKICSTGIKFNPDTALAIDVANLDDNLKDAM